MGKILGLLLTFLFLTNCGVETVAFLGPASTSSGGNLTKSALSSAVSYGVKKQTGKSPSEHALDYMKEFNPENKKEKCVKFLESTNSKICSAIKENISQTKNKVIKQKIIKSSKIEDLARNSDIHKIKSSKIEDLARNSDIHKRR